MEFGNSVFKFLTCTSKTLGRNILSMYPSDLKSYISAFETDPNLQSFDSSFRELANKFISSRSAGGETQSSSIDSHKEVYEFLFQLSQDTSRFIAENREDVWKDKDLKSLVDAYFNNTQTILDFCNTVQNCVAKAEMNQLIIQIAVEQFDKEENGDDDMNQKKKKYAKTLKALNKFIAMEDPFNEDFSKKYELLYEQQLLLLKELHKQKNKPDKELRDIKKWKILSNAVFATALVSVSVLSLAAAEDESPGLVQSIALLTGPLVSTGKWFNDMCKEFEKALKRRKIDVESIEMGVVPMNVPMRNMKAEAEGLKTKIESILDTVELGVGKEDEVINVRVVMQRIKDNIDEFTLKIKQVGEAAAKCSESIAPARLDVLKHITT